ncbi:MAG: cobyrinate a,c-diamide synthase [Ruminococcus sp.]|nr:cobyrinate a,c-diamide synthase [Ruminococcus sp.]
MRRIMIAGANSGCGKTTITCSLLKSLQRRKLKLSSFKCGPDYIDPMFHKKVISLPSYNLDSFFCDDNTIKYLILENSKNSDISIIEGVMGFYDGGRGSAFSISEITDTPIIMVINCRGMSESLGAVMKGFLTYKTPNKIIGFIFNKLPKKLEKQAISLCEELNTEYFGFFPENDFNFDSRHLGLVTADEIINLNDKLVKLADLCDKYILINKILKFSESDNLNYQKINLNSPITSYRPTIAISNDNAFCFNYSDNIALLENMGCHIKYFSPLDDKYIPKDADGLILSGGYPELHAKKLSLNRSMIDSVKSAINSGIPTVAECGGFMYLHEFLEDKDGRIFPMAGIINGTAYKTDRLGHFGYVTLKPKNDSLLFKKSDNIASHEFHYWESTANAQDLLISKRNGTSWNGGICNKSLYAGFPHLYFYSDLNIPRRLIKSCIKFGEKNGKN